MTDTTQAQPLADGIVALRSCALTPTDYAILTRASATALVRELEQNAEDFQVYEYDRRRLAEALATAKEGLREAESTIANLTAVNDNLAASLDQHAEEADDDAEVAGIIAGHLQAELDRALYLLGQTEIALGFYRQLAIDGVRINRATDAAFLTALELDL